MHINNFYSTDSKEFRKN